MALVGWMLALAIRCRRYDTMSNRTSKYYWHNYEISENSKKSEKFEGIWLNSLTKDYLSVNITIVERLNSVPITTIYNNEVGNLTHI